MQRNQVKFQEYYRTPYRNSEEGKVIESIETFQIFIISKIGQGVGKRPEEFENVKMSFCGQIVLDIYFTWTFGSRYSRMDRVKFVEDSLYKIWSVMACLSRPYHFKFFKGYLPQVLLGPFLNSLTHLYIKFICSIEYIDSYNMWWVFYTFINQISNVK